MRGFAYGLYDWIFEALRIPEPTRTKWLEALFG